LSHASPVRIRRLCGLAALWGLFATPVAAAALYLAWPPLLDKLFGWYAPVADEGWLTRAYEAGSHLDPVIVRYYLQRTAVEALTRYYPLRWAAALLAGLLFGAGCALAFLRSPHGTDRPLGPGRAAAFFLLGTAVLFSFYHSLWAPVFAGLLVLSLAVNFLPVQRLAGPSASRAFAAGTALLAPLGVFWFLAPGLCFACAARGVLPGRPDTGRGITAAKGLFCLGSFFLVCAAYTDLVPLPPDPGVVRLVDADQLYDVEVDAGRGRVLATRKWAPPGSPNLYVLDAEHPARNIQARLLAVEELEDLAVEPDTGHLYHVDSFRNALIVLNPGEWSLVRSIPLSFGVAGSAKIFPAWERGLLAVSFEGLQSAVAPGLAQVRTADGGSVLKRYSTLANPVAAADEERGLWYVHLGNTRDLVAYRMGTFEEAGRAMAPKADSRMAFSPARDRLYLADPLAGEVWEVAVPELALLGKIPAELGVRGLAVAMVERIRVGRYFRQVAVDPRRARAYATLTLDGLFMVDYGGWEKPAESKEKQE